MTSGDYEDGDELAARYGDDAEEMAEQLAAPRDAHKLTQTAFRIPEGLLAWLRQQAEHEQRTMTGIVIDALRAYQASNELAPQ